MSNISIDQKKCTLCEACIEACPRHVLFSDHSGVQVHYEEQCMACGHCVAVCPVNAVKHQELEPNGFLPSREGAGVSPEDLYYSLRARRSCRVYATKEVPRELLERLIDIARFAPTGRNWQDFEFLVIGDKSKVEKLSQKLAIHYGNLAKELEASGESIPYYLKKAMYSFRKNYEFFLQGKDRIFRGAPVVILVHARADNPESVDNCLYAVFHMLMMAEALGLGTCINGFLIRAAERDPEILEGLGIPEGHKIQGCITVGFPKSKFHRFPPRRPPKVRWM
jgi:nitroreductase/NAD-dependent dihydropyrimidine dehydrogenase PreA subunit